MRNEKGAVLLTTLIFLLILTMLGFSAIDMNLVNQKMLSNKQNKMIAFNSAEIALREAEAYIEELSSTAGFTESGNNGLFKYDGNVHYKVWESVNWLDADDVVFANKKPEKGAASGRYIIEEYSEIKAENDDLNLSNYGSSIASEKTEVFRITAYGVGATADTYVILQTTFGKKF